MKRSKKAFTLVELIIVIAVIGVLAAILIPVFSSVIDKANAKSALSDQKNAITQLLAHAAEVDSGILIMPDTVILSRKGGKVYVALYSEQNSGVVQLNNGEGIETTLPFTDANVATILADVIGAGELAAISDAGEITYKDFVLAELNAASSNGTGYAALVQDLNLDPTQLYITWDYVQG